MSKSTLYNFTSGESTTITDEIYASPGSDNFQLGTVKRAFIEDGFQIEDADSGGNVLTKDVDYELTEKDSHYTSVEGVNVWTAVKILNVFYQTQTLYITYKVIGSYTDAVFLNTLRTDVDTNTTNISSIQGQLGDVKEITTSDSPYTIESGYNRFLIDSSDGDITVNLNTIASSANASLEFIQTVNGGRVTIDPSGGETINGESQLYLMSLGDRLKIIAGTSEWSAVNYYAHSDTGWFNISDWTNRQPGSSTFDYDNLSGTFTVGETITEATSNNTGIIQSDTGSTIIVKNVTGTGIWTNDRVVTGGTSGATADVNEVSGSNKNQDSDLFHQFGFNATRLRYKFYNSSDGTEANSVLLGLWAERESGNAFDLRVKQVDTNNVEIQTGSNGVGALTDVGGWDPKQAEDEYGKLIVEAYI